MTWVNGKRLASISATSGHSALAFTYDADGLRLTKTVGSVQHKYIWQGGKLVSENYGSTTLEFFYDESGAPYALIYNGTTYYYVTNLQGDVVKIVNASGTSQAEYSYNAWGQVISATGTLAAVNPIRYRGYYYDSESGFYYLKSRYYDPQICRFINADGLASTGQSFLGCNMFAYCNNNPVSHSDQYGARMINAVMVADGGGRKTSDEDPYSITYDVPLYDQGSYRLCWAYCQLMIKSYFCGEVLSAEDAEKGAIEIAKKYNGDENWNKGVLPSKIGKKRRTESITDLYLLLYNKGPLYAYYYNDNGAHLVVVTGVNVETGMVYTNNPWNVAGIQSYSDFSNGFVGLDGETKDGYNFGGIYVPKKIR